MRTLVMIAHPNMEQSIVNRMWKDALIHEAVDVVDLYKQYPDSQLDVSTEQARLLNYDAIVFQFPLYWYSSPPLLKQYLDEVLLFNYAYGPKGTKLQNKKFAIATTVGSLEADYSEEGSNHYTLETLLSPFIATFNYIGAHYQGYFAQYGTVNHATTAELAEGTKRYVEFV
ncbi:NAD(P)H-dependent oxidoreductase [Staphylococcus simulans]|uniref:NAD(P)H-dependent oxidoreductase n=1 Tax=Staphylococcus simulans TaxID=1286 RepID=UPI00399AC22B